MADIPSRYTYAITVEPLPRPVAGLRFIAKVQHLSEQTPDGAKRLVTVSFPQRWGSTEDEAREKLAATVERWIASMQRRPDN